MMLGIRKLNYQDTSRHSLAESKSGKLALNQNKGGLEVSASTCCA